MQKTHTILICLLMIMGVISMITNNSCKKDDNVNSPADTTVKDIDGNVYHAVTIGTQVWMLENLKTTRYRNGDSIPKVTNALQWYGLTSGAQCSYNNDIAMSNKYGRLYNFYAVSDSRNIAPEGWHVAKDAEWTTLMNYVDTHLGISGSESKALAAKTDWVASASEGAVGNDLTINNSSGFTALPGSLYYNGEFKYIGSVAYWWSSTEFMGSGVMRSMYTDDYWVIRATDSKLLGLSVRCVRD